MAVREVEIDLPEEDQLNPVPPVEEGEEEEFEIYGPGEEAPPEEETQPEPSEAEKELAALKAQMQERNAQSEVFGTLAETLKELKKPATVVENKPAPPPFDFDKFNETLKEKMFENPAEAMAMFQQTFAKPQTDALDAKMREIDFKTERIETLSKGDNMDIYSKYQSEVDAAVESLGKGPGSMEKAISMVKGNHLEEITSERLDKLLEEKLAALKTTETQNKGTGYTGVNNMPSTPAKSSKKVRVFLTEADEREAAASPLSREKWIKREYARGRWSK